MGLDAREVTPELARVVVHLASEVRSFERAESVTEKVLGNKVPRSTIRRLAKQVGEELAALQNGEQPSGGKEVKEVTVPQIAVASCDGGRIRTREPNQGRGVHLTGENGWRETKNASFEKMRPPKKHQPDSSVEPEALPAPAEPHAQPGKGDAQGERPIREAEDPCAALPTSFRTASKVANIAEKPAPPPAPGDGASVAKADRVVYQGPRRVMRTAISSMACSEDFGPMMQKEAERRRFFQAPLRAFLGDGLNWNWSIWKKHFPTFTPILDFIHAIQYVYGAAMAMTSDATAGWTLYVQLITLCWQGQVEEVIAQLKSFCQERGLDWEGQAVADDHYQPLLDAIRYLTNNRARMDYPRYRRLGLPISSAPMESLIKQMNHRVKGTEMTWDEPDGAEAILHLRAAALSEDGRLDDYLRKRPGWPFHRRTAPTIAA